MRAIVIHAAKDLRIEDRGRRAGPSEVEVRIETGGICGRTCTITSTAAGTVRVKEPMILGREVGGRIAGTAAP
jgi:L-idonate 5-dehydrogenase